MYIEKMAQRKWSQNLLIHALFLYRIEYCHQMWFQKAEHMQPTWILPYKLFLPCVHIMLQMHFHVIFFPSQNLCRIHLVTHNLFYKQDLREVVFLLLRNKCTTTVINDLQRIDQKTKPCTLTNVVLRKSLEFLFVCFLRVDNCHWKE